MVGDPSPKRACTATSYPWSATGNTGLPGLGKELRESC